MYDLRNEPEIFEWDRNKPQILTGSCYSENIHIAIGYASRCWDNDGVFDTVNALRIANELCAYFRLHREGKVP